MALTFKDYILNNAKHFGTFGSDLPLAYLAPKIEHDSSRPYTGDFLRNGYSPFGSSNVNLGTEPESVSYPSSARSLTPSKVKAVDYINADLAKHYGMSKSTAYQEALANTGYQRSVADMKAAGLNPAVLFGSGHGSPANSSVYASSGGSGRSYGGRSSGNDKLFSGSAYSFLQAVGGLVGIAVTGKPDGFWIGSQTAKGAMGLLDSISKK